MRERLFTLNEPHAMRISGELAAEVGLMESILLLQFEFLLSITRVERRGKPWIKATLEELRAEHFQWSSRATIWRAIQSLLHGPAAKVTGPLVVVENFNQAGFDKTQWFTLNMKNVSKLKSVRVFQTETVESGTVFQDEIGPVFQDETSQVSATESQAGKTESFQNETGGRESRQDVSDRDVEGRESRHRRDQNETTIERDLQAGDLQPSPEGDANVLALDSGKQTSEILKLALRPRVRYVDSWKGHLASQIRKHLEKGFAYHVVLEAAKICEHKALNPTAMPSLVNQVLHGSVSTNTKHKPFDPADQNYDVDEQAAE